MTVTKIKQLTVDWQPSWGKWPDTDDKDYTSVLTGRTTTTYERGGDSIEVEERFLPAYMAFASCGEELPITHQWIDNTKLPSQAVIDRQIADLQSFGAECDVIHWPHARNCYPEVAKHIPELFKLAILSFADDCPGSSEIKTFPVAQWFDAFYYQMKIWDFATGAVTADKYAEVAPNLKPYFKGQNESAGLIEGIENLYFNPGPKADAIESGYLPVVDFVFLGYRAWHWRGDFCNSLNGADFGDLKSALYGQDMRDGMLGNGPGGKCGYEAAKLYSQSLIGVNPQVSSIFNGRLIDLWTCGVVQMVHDPHGELASEGFIEGEHFVSFDGSTADCIGKAKELKADPKRCARIIRAAFMQAMQYQREKSTPAVYASIYADWIDKVTGRHG